MYSNNRLTRADRTLDYVPYFYESGIVQRYLESQNTVLRSLTASASSTYDFTSDLTRRSGFYHTPTVEQIIASGYFAVPQADPVSAMISDKQHTSRLGLGDIIRQIRDRYQMYEKNFYELEVSKCAVITGLYTHEAWHGPSDSRVEYSVNKRLDKLYEQQRQERTDLWRDISRLKLLLPEQAQLYLASYRKASLLEDQKGDGP